MNDLKPPAGDILEMESSGGDDGRIVYASKKHRSPRRAALGAWLVRLVGIALGVGFFLLVIFLFVYVVVPLAVILVVCFLIRGLLVRR